MHFFSKIAHSIVSLFSMDPPQVLQSPTDGHKIWHSLLDNSVSLADYLDRIDTHYSVLGVICGPDDWFVSRVAAYKRDDGERHELLLITAKRTPRLPAVPGESPPLEDGQDGVMNEAWLIVERRVENNETGKGKSTSRGAGSPKNDQDHQNEGNGSSGSLSNSCSLGSNTMVRWVWGGRVARDTARFTIPPKTGLRGYDELGYMEFPTPPHLPPDNDFRAALKILENPPPQPAPQSSRFVSLPTLISLASFISGRYPIYTPTDTNCYWFCAMVIHMLRRYARVNFVLLNKAGKTVVKIGPEELRAAIDNKVKEAKSAIGSCSFLTITGTPGDKRIATEGEEWKLQEETRVKKLQDVRRAELTRMKEAEDELEEERKRRKEVEDAIVGETKRRKEVEDAIVGETKKRQGETRRRLNEKKKRMGETKKRMGETKKKHDAMKRVGEEKKRAEAEKQRAEAEKQRAEAEKRQAEVERQRADNAARELAESHNLIAEMQRQLDALKTDH